MSPARGRWRRGSRVDRLRDRGDVRGLVRVLRKHDWVVDRDGMATDLEVKRRTAAAAALGAIKGRAAEDGLVLALADDHPAVRRAAVEALGPTPSPYALKALSHAAATWREPSLEDARAAAVQLLVEVGDELHAVEYTQVLVADESRSSLSAEEVSTIRMLFGADS